MSAGFLCFLWRYRIIDVDPCVTQELGSLLVGNNNKFTVVQTCLQGDRLDSNCKIVRCFHFSVSIKWKSRESRTSPDPTLLPRGQTPSRGPEVQEEVALQKAAVSCNWLMLEHLAQKMPDIRSSEKNRKRTSWAWWIYKLKWPILMIYIRNMVL